MSGESTQSVHERGQRMFVHDGGACDPEYESAERVRGPSDRVFSSSCSLPFPRLLPAIYSHLTRVDMSTLSAAIDALKTVSIICGMLPVVGGNLKSAVELASTICEQVQVRSKNSRT
jgi:hypothetical protein